MYFPSILFSNIPITNQTLALHHISNHPKDVYSLAPRNRREKENTNRSNPFIFLNCETIGNVMTSTR